MKRPVCVNILVADQEHPRGTVSAHCRVGRYFNAVVQ